MQRHDHDASVAGPGCTALAHLGGSPDAAALGGGDVAAAVCSAVMQAAAALEEMDASMAAAVCDVVANERVPVPGAADAYASVCNTLVSTLRLHGGHPGIFQSGCAALARLCISGATPKAQLSALYDAEACEAVADALRAQIMSKRPEPLPAGRMVIACKLLERLAHTAAGRTEAIAVGNIVLRWRGGEDAVIKEAAEAARNVKPPAAKAGSNRGGARVGRGGAGGSARGGAAGGAGRGSFV